MEWLRLGGTLKILVLHPCGQGCHDSILLKALDYNKKEGIYHHTLAC